MPATASGAYGGRRAAYFAVALDEEVLPSTTLASIGQREEHISQKLNTLLSPPSSALAPTAPRVPGAYVIASKPVAVDAFKKFRLEVSIFSPFLK